jgi:glycosyltransferase involved in cell wall biosynthesis
LAALYPACAGKTHVLGYPVRADAFAEDWAPARHAHGRVRVLFMGGDFPRKGGPDLLAAWRAGAFADRAELDLVTDWPLTDGDLPVGVRLVGGIAPYTEAWRAIWRDADIFVMPTRHEAFGMVFQEAAAAGLPVVATAINAIPEIVEDGTTGLLVPPGDTPALVAALGRLIDDAALRCRLGRTARARMLTAAAPSRFAARLGALIEQVARNHA